MDNIFGWSNFRIEIVWCYELGGSSKRSFSKKHDTVFLYSKTNSYCFDKPTMPSTSAMMAGEEKGMVDYWNLPTINNQAKERVGYQTQQPLALLERIIKASSNGKDLVLDPFCGCAATCIANKWLERQWVGVDVSKKACELV